MVFRLFSIFCNSTFRHLQFSVSPSPLSFSAFSIISFCISNYSFGNFHLSVSASSTIHFDISISRFGNPFRHLQLSVSDLQLSVSVTPIICLGISHYPFRAASSKSGRFTLKNLSLTNIYKRTNRIDGTLNVYFQADIGDVFW